MSGRAVPRAEGLTFESGSGGMRMEKDSGAAAAVQPLYIRAGRLSDPPFGGHSPGNSRTRKPVCGHGVYVCALHGVSPRDRWSCVLPRWQFNVNVNVKFLAGLVFLTSFLSYDGQAWWTCVWTRARQGAFSYVHV
jgi:hypothetical protein